MIPSKEQCDYIVEKNEAFVRVEHVIDFKRVHVYDYRLASYQDFDNPTRAQTKSHVLKAYELRGLTFVEEQEGKWKTNLALHKFFNVNETIGYEISTLEKKKISSVYNKLDGSLISFIKISDNWYPKTKTLFDNSQTQAVYRIIQSNPDYLKFLENCWLGSLVPTFEYTSAENQVVLKYSQPELSLLQVRCNLTGQYYDLRGIDSLSIPKAQMVFDSDIDLKTLIELSEVLTDTEGWIIQFEDGQLAKLKTEWYRNLHQLKDSITSSNKAIVALTLSNSIDDALTLIDHEPNKSEILELIDATRKHFNRHLKRCEELVQSRGDYESDKAFAIAFKDYLHFSTVMSFLKGQRKNLESALKESIRSNFKRSKKIPD